jgi:hypothetical protein
VFTFGLVKIFTRQIVCLLLHHCRKETRISRHAVGIQSIFIRIESFSKCIIFLLPPPQKACSTEEKHGNSKKIAITEEIPEKVNDVCPPKLNFLLVLRHSVVILTKSSKRVRRCGNLVEMK